MSSGLPSDEVAEDYKASLEDLVTNDRNQIGVLTVIAKENTEHAMAISRVLENHIRSAPPSRKLPALYVLDSIVKNVGTPYTLYFQRNLYQTFMGAYTLVDSNIRKKLDEMLKTWKEPVPGSLDTRPVFPAESIREIENALIKARTAALQQQARAQSAHPQMRASGTPPNHWRNTPPPGMAQQYGQPMPGQLPPSRNGMPSYNTSGYPSQQYPMPQSQPQIFTQYQNRPPSVQPSSMGGSVDLVVLNQDVDNLIAATRTEFASNISDTGIQQKLKALLDLKTLLTSQALPEHQLRQIRDKVSQMAPGSQPIPRPTPPPVPVTAQTITASVPLPSQQPTPQPAIPSFINSANLAELLRATASRNQPTPPPLQPSAPPLSMSQAVQTPPMARATPVPPAAENPLIAQLRAAGLLPNTAMQQATSQSSFASVLGTTAHQFPVQIASTSRFSVRLTTASIKTPRPELIVSLYDDRPNRCTTCGRRFTTDSEGKEKKSRHLDWHFKTNTRLAEAAKRGQSRSWYVDEREWISSREYEDDSGPPESVNGTATTVKMEQYIPAPNDPVLRNAPCPICQEKFESTWSEDVQEFIWKDALKVGNRIYHASCYKEATKDKEGGATPLGAGRGRTATPDSVLGKRKAEQDEISGLTAKVKIEPT